MAEKKKDEEKSAKEKGGKAAARKSPAKKPARKTAAKKPMGDKPGKGADASEKPPQDKVEPLLEEEREAAAEEGPVEAPPQEKEEELSEEEIRRLLEESLETVTVADIVLTMMNQLASTGYMKMGLPESVNMKYRDFAQARLAIDTLEAMLKAAEGKVPGELLQPFRGTLANLQMNYVQLMRGNT